MSIESEVENSVDFFKLKFVIFIVHVYIFQNLQIYFLDIDVDKYVKFPVKKKAGNNRINVVYLECL